MRDAIRWLAGQPELLNAAAPFALLCMIASIACAIVAFEAFRELVETAPAGSRSRDLLIAGFWGTGLAVSLATFTFIYLYAVNWRAAMAPSCEPIRYLAGV